MHDAVAAVAFVAWGWATRRQIAWSLLLPVAGWCALLFAGADVLFVAASGHVSGGTGTLVFALVPFFTVLLMSQSDDAAMRALMPAVIAVGGLALVVHFLMPVEAAGFAWLAAMVAMAGLVAFAGVRLYVLLVGVELVWAGAAGAGAAALLAGVCWRMTRTEAVGWGWRTVLLEALWGLVADGALVVLTLWVLRAVPPIGSAARFVLVPALTVLSGIVVERPAVGWYGWVGLVVALGASFLLLREDPAAAGNIGA